MQRAAVTQPASATASAQQHRATIFIEDAAVLSVRRYAGAQFVLRLKAPRCAARATAGSFVHVRCDAAIPMRRPLSIMRADAAEGWIEVLFKVVGEGLRSLGNRSAGESVSIIGPIGRGFKASPERPRALLVGGGVGIPPIIFLAETLHAAGGAYQPLVLMGSELPFPFQRRPSALPAPWLAPAIDSAMQSLEDLAIPSRLASLSDFDGCLKGYVTELASRWLDTLSPAERAATEVFACGPTPMLAAVARLARQHGVPCQVSLEEYMACAVGGCAGCTVPVQDDDGPAMRRVCVDGPVFDAARVFGN